MPQIQVFRKAALARLATPEALDRALTVTTAREWLALLAVAVILAAVASWSILAEVSTFVQAHGILLNRGGRVVDAVSSGAGTLNTVANVDVMVETGDVVAEIVNQEVAERYRSVMALVDERARALEVLERTLAEEDILVTRNIARQRTRLEQIERRGRQALETARERLESHRQLFEERVVTRAILERSQQAFDQTERDLFGTRRERDDLESREIRRRHDNDARIADVQARLQAAQRQANELQTVRDTNRILAPVSGRVTEVKVSPGSVLRAGQPVLSITTGTGELEVLIYLPPAEGKRVKPGMDALVSPSTVRREEYGSLKGTVENVSSFPISLEGMIAVLQNRKLAETFSESGSPYSGRVTLVLDPSTSSGFAWTSPKAANTTLSSGTLASVEVKVDSRPPITLVVPLLKETFGL